MKTSDKVLIVDPKSPYYKKVGTIIKITTSFNTETYSVSVSLDSRIVNENFEDNQIRPYGTGGWNRSKVGTKVTIKSKDRSCDGQQGTVINVPDDDNIVYVELDHDDKIIWFLESEVQKEETNWWNP